MFALKNSYRKATTALGVGVLTLANGVSAFAAGDDFKLQQSGSINNNPDGLDETLPKIAQNAINILLIVAGILAVIYLIWSGFLYITSAGNADKAKAARNGIINTVIGIIVIVAAYWIINVAISGGQTVNSSINNNSGGGFLR